jgi:DNA-binding phage protein
MQETPMPLTRDFRNTVKARAERDPTFRAALFEEAVQAIVEGDLPVARILLRDVINATTGFKRLSKTLGVGEKSLMRMYGPNGNPRADNLLATLAALRSDAGVEVRGKASVVSRRVRKPTRARSAMAA